MSRPACGDDEDLVRGITSAHYQDGVVTGKFFAGKAVSVNRLVITDLTTSLEIFERELSDPEKGVSLQAYTTFKHKALKDKTAEYVAANKDMAKDFQVVVEQAPINDPGHENPGHAEVMPRVPGGLANSLFNDHFFAIEKVNSQPTGAAETEECQ
jgi:hypothetical protein